jgi:hypothetical protein
VDSGDFKLDEPLGARSRSHRVLVLVLVPDDPGMPRERKRRPGGPVEEQQAGTRVDDEVAQRLEHAVAAVVGEDEPAPVV